jgi:Carboxypeptidase regulatory-like domain
MTKFNLYNHMNKQQSSTKIDSNDTPTRSNPTSLSLTIEPFYVVTPGATYGLSGKLTDLRHGRPMRSQRIIFENGEGIPPINSTTTDDSGNFRVSGLRAPTTEGDYNLRARFKGRGGYEPSASHVITLRVYH